MGEYDAKQRNQLCTVIVNGNTGSKQLKGFVDNRCTTQKVASQIKVIQKASIEEWCNGVRKASSPTITLYTHIIDDGFGDAGQLGYLVDKVRPLGYKTIPYATYRGPREASDIKKIHDLSRIGNNKYLKEGAGAGWISEIDDNTWEIQYPVPMDNPNIDKSKVLKIWEMGREHYNSLFGYNTGIGKLPDTNSNVHNPIGGYGIPQYVSNPDDEKKLNETLRKFGIILDSSPPSSTESKDLYPSLKDAWLVKVNEGQSVDTILGKAKEKGCTLLILLGGENVKTAITASDNKIDKVYYIPFLEQNILSCLMSKIGCSGGKGMIFAGGEGMYVQALGASSEAAVGNVTRGDGYVAQTSQIFADLIRRKSDDEKASDLIDCGLSLAKTSRLLDTFQTEILGLNELDSLNEEEKSLNEEEKSLNEEEKSLNEEEESLNEEEKSLNEEEESLNEEQILELISGKLDYYLTLYDNFLNISKNLPTDADEFLYKFNMVLPMFNSININSDDFHSKIKEKLLDIELNRNQMSDIHKKVHETLTTSIEFEKRQSYQRELSEVESELSKVESKLSEAKGKLSEVESKLSEAKGKLSEAKGKLSEVESRLSDVKSKLPDVKGKLSEVESKLPEVKDKLSKLLESMFDFNPYEPLGMMDIPQQELKAHSDWVRRPEHNWFNTLNEIDTLNRVTELYKWLNLSSLPENILISDEIMTRKELISYFYENVFSKKVKGEKIENAGKRMILDVMEIKSKFEANKLEDAYYDYNDGYE